MKIVVKKKGQAILGRGSIKNNNGNIIKLPRRVKALVNFILSSDFFKRIFHETCPTAPVRMAKNRILSNLIS